MVEGGASLIVPLSMKNKTFGRRFGCVGKWRAQDDKIIVL